MKRTIRILLVFLVLTALPTRAFAQDGLLTLVTEVRDDTASFWWSAAAPAWTATDAALRSALEREGAGFANPVGANLSKIYRRPAPTDAGALAMASVFGHSRVLVGTITYSRTALSPVGLAGAEAAVDLRLVAASGGEPTTLAEIRTKRADWAHDETEAMAAVRSEVAELVARSVGVGLSRRVGPVGYQTGELLLGFRDLGGSARLDAIRTALLGFAGVTDVAVRWAAEGFVALEVNPGAADPVESIRQYAALLGNESFKDFRLVGVDAAFGEVVEFRVEGVQP